MWRAGFHSPSREGGSARLRSELPATLPAMLVLSAILESLRSTFENNGLNVLPDPGICELS